MLLQLFSFSLEKRINFCCNIPEQASCTRLDARLYLSNFPAFIQPANEIEQQAEYWKIHYMGGNGYTDSELQLFVDKVHELEQLIKSIYAA